MSWAFLLVVFAALCFLAMTIGVLVMVFRAATRTSGRPPGEARREDGGDSSPGPGDSTSGGG